MPGLFLILKHHFNLTFLQVSGRVAARNRVFLDHRLTVEDNGEGFQIAAFLEGIADVFLFKGKVEFLQPHFHQGDLADAQADDEFGVVFLFVWC